MPCSSCKRNKAKATKVKASSTIRKPQPAITSIKINGKKYKGLA